MNVTIHPGPLSGTLVLPGSKSQGHRLLMAAALAKGESRISNVTASRDIEATLACLTALGAEITRSGKTLTVRGGGDPQNRPALRCGESGSTLRFLIPVALAVAGGGTFQGSERLMERPLAPYFDIFREKGIAFSGEGNTLRIEGRLTPGVYHLPGNVSSQFITGLMYALPLLEGDSEIRLTAPLESAGYVDMTRDALRAFGIEVRQIPGGWLVPGGQRYCPADATAEGDWSQGAFFLAAQAMGHDLDLAGLSPDSRQGDRIVTEYLARLNAPGEAELDVRDCPDLVPALAARAALRDGEITRITNAARLRLKESDRLAAVAEVLRALGAEIREEPEGLTIRGKKELEGGAAADAWNDHRIAMMAAVAATRCERPVTIHGAECVRKSYPEFWRDFAKLGGKLEVLE